MSMPNGCRCRPSFPEQGALNNLVYAMVICLAVTVMPFALANADTTSVIRAPVVAQSLDPRVVERLRELETETSQQANGNENELRAREQSERELATEQRRPASETKGGPLRRPGLTAQARLDHYRAYARYPPMQQPLHDSHVDIIQPYAPVGGSLVVHRNARGERVESDLPCRFQPERRIAVGTEPFGVTLSCGTESRPETILLDSAQLLLGLSPGKKPRAEGRVLTQSDRKGGYYFKVNHGTNDWGWITLEVTFTHEGKQHKSWTQWESTPEAPAVFLLNEIIYKEQGGHLFVQVPVDVRRPGVFEIHANLQEAGGEQRYIAQTGGPGELAAGKQLINLRFFGKVLHDQGIDGPYRVRMIRGYRVNTPVGVLSSVELDRALMQGGKGMEATAGKDNNPPIAAQKAYIEPVDTFNLPTGYRASRFSDEEWASPAKDRRLKLLERMASE